MKCDRLKRLEDARDHLLNQGRIITTCKVLQKSDLLQQICITRCADDQCSSNRFEVNLV